MSNSALHRIAILSLACSLTAASVDDTVALGRKALANEGIATAWKLSQAAVSEAPDSAAAHEFSAEVLFRRGEFEQAENQFKLAAKLDPNFALAWWGLARISECTSRNKTAAQYFQRAYELNPRDPRIFRDWAAHLSGSQQIEALQKYASMLDLSRPERERNDLRQAIELGKALHGRPTAVLASPYQPTELPLAAWTAETNHMRHFGLEVSLNDTKLNLVLDTGAAGIVIPQRAAVAAGITRLSEATLGGFGDDAKTASGYRAIVPRIRIGTIEFHDVLIAVSNQASVGTMDGLIGSSVFAQFLITLDFPARKLRLDPLPGYHLGDHELHDRAILPEMQHFAPVFRFGHLLLVPTRVSNSREVLFALDTGADRSLISYDLAAEVSKLNHDDRMHLNGVNGQVADVYQTGDLLLQFAGYRQKNLGMTAFDTLDQSRRFGVEISGFLGLPVLDLFTLTIDYRNGLVNFSRRD
jgi:gag-polyprotein putative aspartyl protease/tetratricopeptide repeat protein/aspartyl protease